LIKRKKKGGQPGNQNARRHGFYSQVLDEAEQLELEVAHGISGIDEEIALLRVKIRSLVENDPDNIRLIMEASNTLARLLRTKYSLDKHQGKGVKEAIANVLKDIALPLGIGIGAVVSK